MALLGMYDPQRGPVMPAGRAVPHDQQFDRSRSGREQCPGLADRVEQVRRHACGASIARLERELESDACLLATSFMHGEAASRPVPAYRCRPLDALRVAPRTPVAQLPPSVPGPGTVRGPAPHL